MQKTLQYRLYPTKSVKRILENQLSECCFIYNFCLSVRKTTYEQTDKSLNYYDFAKQLPDLKEAFPELKQVHSQVLQDVLKRNDKAYQNFFRRIKQGGAPGYPRYKNKDRYDSITYPQYGNGCSVEGSILHFSKTGDIKMVLHREIEGQIKTVTIRRTKTGKWFVSFVVETEPKRLPANGNAIGLDVGLKSFIKFNNNEDVENPKFFKQDEIKLKKLQSRKDKETNGSRLRKTLSKRVTHLHEKIANKRKDFIHKISRKIVNKYEVIALERLNVKKMMEDSYFAKSIGDAAWTQFRMAVSYKAVEAGRKYIEVDPAYTSQTCSGCGTIKKLELKDRVYKCESCGLELDRDHNAAINILTVGMYSLNLTTGFRSPRL